MNMTKKRLKAAGYDPSITPRDIRRAKKAGITVTKGMTQNDLMLAGMGRTEMPPAHEDIPDTETEPQREKRITERFTVMKLMAESVAKGMGRSLIVSGPAGVGKSFGIMEVLDDLQNMNINHAVVKGFVRPTGLYKTLYEHRFPNCVVVFDDADSVFMDDVSLNILKGACDTTKTRKISWRAETKMTTEDGESLPTSFEFEGSIIFITNYDFDSLIARGNRLAPHFEALISRSHYLDLTLKNKKDYLCRIKQVIAEGMLDDVGIPALEQSLVVDFIEENVDQMRELSLRMVVKLANLMLGHKRNWQMIAKATCFRNVR